MPRVSGSALALLRACAYPFRDDLAPLPPEAVSRASVVGSASHAVIAAALGHAAGEPFALSEDERATADACAARALDWLAALPGRHEAEVAYAWDVRARKARRLVQRHARDYSDVDRSHEIPCTLDVVSHRFDGSIVNVYDWKTGRAAHVEPARDNAQLLLGALCVAHETRAPSIGIGIVFLGDGSEPARASLATVDDVDLDAFAAELARLHASIATAAPTPGPHCVERYCRRLGQCDATRSALLAVAAPEAPQAWPVVVDARDIVDAAHAAWLLETARLAEAVSGRATAAVRAWTAEHGGTLPLGDGRVYGPSPGPGRIDARVALPVLAAEGLDLDVAAPRSVSRDSIGEGFRARGGEAISAGVRRVVAAIEAAGGVTGGGERWTTRKA